MGWRRGASNRRTYSDKVVGGEFLSESDVWNGLLEFVIGGTDSMRLRKPVLLRLLLSREACGQVIFLSLREGDSALKRDNICRETKEGERRVCSGVRDL